MLYISAKVHSPKFARDGTSEDARKGVREGALDSASEGPYNIISTLKDAVGTEGIETEDQELLTHCANKAQSIYKLMVGIQGFQNVFTGLLDQVQVAETVYDRKYGIFAFKNSVLDFTGTEVVVWGYQRQDMVSKCTTLQMAAAVGKCVMICDEQAPRSVNPEILKSITNPDQYIRAIISSIRRIPMCIDVCVQSDFPADTIAFNDLHREFWKRHAVITASARERVVGLKGKIGVLGEDARIKFRSYVENPLANPSDASMASVDFDLEMGYRQAFPEVSQECLGPIIGKQRVDSRVFISVEAHDKSSQSRRKSLMRVRSRRRVRRDSGVFGESGPYKVYKAL
ncbi:hypothetical protein BC829DRAFT_418139 [Chytridium lagenaria]|nr:hypothetical protein BC829DRAFT_418139 [Chytridium lagenaria]